MIPNCATRKDGKPVCTMSAATDESYTDRNGQRVDRAEWHSIVVYGKTAENCAHHLGKGEPRLCGGQPANPQMEGPAGAGPLHHGDQGAARPVPLTAKPTPLPAPTPASGKARSHPQRAGMKRTKSRSRSVRPCRLSRIFKRKSPGTLSIPDEDLTPRPAHGS